MKEKILCNFCGECMCPTSHGYGWRAQDEEDECYPSGLYNVSVTGGYESSHLLDLNKYTFSLCEKCLRSLFEQFKIKPKIDEVSAFGELHKENAMSFEKDQQYYEYNIWREAGGHHKNYLHKICNATKTCLNKAIYSFLYSDEFSEECACEEHKNAHTAYNINLVEFIPQELKTFL